jgi:hypothetical protein
MAEAEVGVVRRLLPALGMVVVVILQLVEMLMAGEAMMAVAVVGH